MKPGTLTKGAADKTAKADVSEARREDREDKHENKGEKQGRAHGGIGHPGALKMEKSDHHLKGSKHFGGKSEY